ncbi:hypothetical protein TKK_0012114 [Trichogramma kaykai]|uniref:Odorant receptor n=1 Tax=Trichogramma kaykai TaxID=54128 RepID=A0ABD2WM93_9HYME
MHSLVRDIIIQNVEYEILPYQFLLLTFWGIWYPQNWSLWAVNIQKSYFVFISFFDIIICTEMLIFFINSFGTSNFKLINFFFVSANITGVYKAIKIMLNRKMIREFLLTYFDADWRTPKDKIEQKIQDDINAKIKRVTLIYSISMLGIVLMKAMSPLTGFNSVSLPVEAWYPYKVEKTSWYWLTYLHQCILGSSAVCAHIGIDTLFMGLLLKTSYQLEVLKHRLRSLNISLLSLNRKGSKLSIENEKMLIIECIKYHQRIYSFGKKLNDKFQDILIILVLSSLPNICINIYTLSTYTGRTKIDIIATLFCTTSAFMQFCIACWFGNEITWNSINVRDALYDLDWTVFNLDSQKLFIFIMTRSMRPMQFKIGYLLSLNLDSFIKIIKASYSSFNILQQTTH